MNDPNFLPFWGNRVETQVQVKPGSSVQPGEQKPYIWAVGGMPVENIAGNAYTLIPSILGPGYANGTSVDGGFSAAESPFGAEIMIRGAITHPPNNPDEAHKLLYKVQYKKLPGGTWHDIDNKFTIYRRIDGVPSGPLDQEAVGGYYKFQKDLEPPVQIEVQDDVLAQWHTPVAEGDGLYEIRVLLYKPGAAPEPGVPADHVASNNVKVVIDNTRPDAMISLDLGGCHEFTVGDNEIPGKFTANDKHIWKYTISILPTIPTVASPPTVDMPAETYPDPDLPRINAPFHVITTKDTSHCGYVVYLYVWDRTIINNYMQGNQNNASVGFCLLE
jgi:hypothetical protein